MRRSFAFKRSIALLVSVFIMGFIPGTIPQAHAQSNYDQGSASFSGSWTTGYSPRAFGGSITYSNTANNTVSFSFYGSRITYIYTKFWNRGNAIVSIDGVVKDSSLDQYTQVGEWQVRRTYAVPTGSHTIQIKVKGSRNSASTDTYVDLDGLIVDIDPVYPSIYDQTSGYNSYIGNWTTGSAPLAYNGSITYSNVAQDGVSFSFYGDTIRVIYTMFWNKGKAAISIDGNRITTLDQYSASAQWQAERSFQLGAIGYHTINISVLGQKQSASTDYYIDIDAMQPFLLQQMIGDRNNEPAGYTGARSYITTPDPSMGNVSGTGKTAAHTAISTVTTPDFFEAGPIKDCVLGFCSYYPYAGYVDSSGVQKNIPAQGVSLVPNGAYLYSSFYIGNNTWEMDWCDANACYTIAQYNRLYRSYPYVSSGGESLIFQSTRIGPLTTFQNQYILAGTTTWMPWCYTSIRNTTGGGTFSACDVPNHAWSISFP